MASIRRLKKDIDCLTFAVVDDSLNCLAVGKSMDDISEIVQHIIDSRNDLRQRVNAGKQVAKEKQEFHPLHLPLYLQSYTRAVLVKRDCQIKRGC